jgi:hypothetical protein
MATARPFAIHGASMKTDYAYQLPGAREAASNDKCDAAGPDHSCEGHCKPAFVAGWGWFSYCDAAIEEDKQHGLDVNLEPA